MNSLRFPSKAAVVSRHVMAALFIFSGAAKSLNPFGLSIQLGEYFSAMGLDFLRPLADTGSIMLPSLELLLGLVLLTGVSRWLSAWAVFLAMAFFTLLTLWIAIADPVNDCGCFGDVIKMSNWGTFAKNIVFLPFTVILFVNRNEPGRGMNPARTYPVIVLLSFLPSVYSSYRLPLVDATPYKIGINVPEAMKAGDSGDSRTLLLYKDIQTGKVHEFDVSDTTWYDSSRWEFVDTKVTGETSGGPAISGIPMIGPDGDISDEMLSRPGYLLILVQTNLHEMAQQQTDRLRLLAAVVAVNDGKAVLLTSSPLPSPLPVSAELEEAGFELLGSDNSTLNTMIQNKYGGIMLLRDGTIVGKWPLNRLPEARELLNGK